MMDIAPLNDQHKQDIGIALGLSIAVRVLRDGKEPFERLPGYNTAMAVVEQIEAQYRAEIAGANFRAAVAAGVDIRTHMIGLHGRGKIFAEPMDLERLSEFTADAPEQAA